MRLSLGCRCFVFYDQYNLGQMLLQPMLQVVFTFCIGTINKYYNAKLGNISKKLGLLFINHGEFDNAHQNPSGTVHEDEICQGCFLPKIITTGRAGGLLAPLGPITSRTYRFIESSFYCMMRPTAIEIAAWRILLSFLPGYPSFESHLIARFPDLFLASLGYFFWA